MKADKVFDAMLARARKLALAGKPLKQDKQLTKLRASYKKTSRREFAGR